MNASISACGGSQSAVTGIRIVGALRQERSPTRCLSSGVVGNQYYGRPRLNTHSATRCGRLSSGSAFIMMVQAADIANLNHLTLCKRLNSSEVRGILVE